ncbi:ATLAS protein, partial [Acromyrmex heyeri]
MDDAFSQFKAHNESKNIFKAARTPAVFFAIAVTMYILSGIFGLVGLYTIANICNLIMGVGLLTLVLWAYIRYSGEFREIGTQIDDLASKIWENCTNEKRYLRKLSANRSKYLEKFMKPLYQQFVEKSVSVAVAQAAEIAVTNSTMNATVTANGKPKLL